MSTRDEGGFETSWYDLRWEGEGAAIGAMLMTSMQAAEANAVSTVLFCGAALPNYRWTRRS